MEKTRGETVVLTTGLKDGGNKRMESDEDEEIEGIGDDYLSEDSADIIDEDEDEEIARFSL